MYLLLFVLSLVLLASVSRVKPMAALQFPVQVINLDTRPDRMKHIRDQYLKTDMPFVLTRIPAVNGQNLDMSTIPMTQKALQDIEFVDEHKHRTQHHQVTRGAVGLYLSQMEAWRRIAEDPNAEYGLVMEDDAILVPDIYRQICKFAHTAPPDWDILLFGHLCKRSSTLLKNYRKVHRFYMLHCYLLTKSCAKYLLENVLPIDVQLDWKLSDLAERGQLKVYATPNSIVRQLGQDTDIQTKVIKDDAPKTERAPSG